MQDGGLVSWTTRRASSPPTMFRPWMTSSPCPAPDVSVCVCLLAHVSLASKLTLIFISHLTTYVHLHLLPLTTSFTHHLILHSHSSTRSSAHVFTSSLSPSHSHTHLTPHSHYSLSPPHSILSHTYIIMLYLVSFSVTLLFLHFTLPLILSFSASSLFLSLLPLLPQGRSVSLRMSLATLRISK